MTRDRTHHYGDDCPGGHRTPRQPDPRVTDEDVAAAIDACHTDGDTQIVTGRDYYQAVLRSTLRPGGLVARAIADELDRVANEVFLYDPGALGVLLHLAQEWREGSR